MQTAERMTYADGMFHIIPTCLLRRTPNVTFTTMPLFDDIASIDHVMHGAEALSPSIPGREYERHWYMHPHQEDNLLVVHGVRRVDLFRPGHSRVERLDVTKDRVIHHGKTIFEGEAILGWAPGTFHRVKSGPEGSNSFNFSRTMGGFDRDTNFNIYKLDTTTGEYELLRYGHEDQPDPNGPGA